MPDNYPKISIVTPVFNQKEFVEFCIGSILNQNYPNLEYIIIDGGSTDGTLDIINKYSAKIDYLLSEPDKGLYDALQKGFAKTTGDIMGWLNSDDILHPHSLFTIAEIFESNDNINWLQGLPAVIDRNNRTVFTRPARHDKFDFLLKEYHDGIFIQQESTYWKRSLWEKAGARISLEYKFAGDFDLWMRFYEKEPLFCTTAMIGAFRYRGEGQLSKDYYAEYLYECDKITDRAIGKLSATDKDILASLKKNKNRVTKFQRLSSWMFGRESTAKGKSENEVYFDFHEYKFKTR
jgi:glycosyltransferase involved in cell wall biosynthesis